MGGSMGGMDDMGGFSFGGPRGSGGGGGSRQPRQSPPMEATLNCSLEELYNGCKKRMKITRQVLNPDGRTTRPEEKILEIDVRKGWKKGTKIRYEREGDQGPNIIPGLLSHSNHVCVCVSFVCVSYA